MNAPHSTPDSLSDDQLLAEVKRLVMCERQATAALIGSLAALDERRLYLREGYGSLFSYCTSALGLSEDAAYVRIEAARACRRFPVLFERLALLKGVRGGKWFSLIDKVYALRTLQAAWHDVRANRGAAGVDHVTVEQFEANLDANLTALAAQLRAGTYRPQAVRRVYIDKPGSREKRPLGIPTVRDRVVQAALRKVLEPIFERDFAAQSYGFRPNRDCKDALRRVQDLLEAGYTWVVDVDLRHYFDTIPHAALQRRIETTVADSRVLALLEAFLTQRVMDTLASWTPEEGTPQGAVMSPLLSNIYLDPLDHTMARDGFEMVRYADDFVVLCRSKTDAEAALANVTAWTVEAGLSVHPEKIRIVDATQPGGFDFLGYHFERGYRWPRRKSLRNFKTNIRAVTRRTNGDSLAVIITHVNVRARGWFNDFCHSHWTTFKPRSRAFARSSTSTPPASRW